MIVLLFYVISDFIILRQLEKIQQHGINLPNILVTIVPRSQDVVSLT